MEEEEIPIAKFINEIVEDVQFLQKNGQTIKVSHNGNQIVFLDSKMLRYILINLLSNALKYSQEDKEVVIHSEKYHKYLFITIGDQGIGIPEEEQKNLFKKFFRAKNTGGIQGTGLGLTIVKRYVELMNGQIEFVSKAGIGTSFTIKLPVDKK